MDGAPRGGYRRTEGSEGASAGSACGLGAAHVDYGYGVDLVL